MVRCSQCFAEVSPSLLSCPNCHGLVHATQLKALAAQADAAAARGDLSEALGAWRTVQSLLPPGSRQHTIVGEKIVELSGRVDTRGVLGVPPPPVPSIPGASTTSSSSSWASSAPAASTSTSTATTKPAQGDGGRWGKWGGVLLGGGLLVWKFKAVLAIVLTKGKLLLLGLTKASTLFSMLGAFGVYWAVFGWKFAGGLIASIYVHEMGHVAALRRFGIKASAPMFIPGFGAIVRMNQHPATAREDARVGLAGPIWGLGAALFCYAAYLLTDAPLWGVLARVGAWINLFNLLPVWQLDGARAFHAMSRTQCWLSTFALAAAWMFTGEGLLVLIALVAAYRAFTAKTREDDWTACAQYAGLVAILSWMTLIHPEMRV